MAYLSKYIIWETKWGCTMHDRYLKLSAKIISVIQYFSINSLYKQTNYTCIMWNFILNTEMYYWHIHQKVFGAEQNFHKLYHNFIKTLLLTVCKTLDNCSIIRGFRPPMPKLVVVLLKKKKGKKKNCQNTDWK